MNKSYAELKRRVFAALRPKGFRVKGSVAWRDTDGNWEIVEFGSNPNWRERPGEVVWGVGVGVKLARVREESYWADDRYPRAGTIDSMDLFALMGQDCNGLNSIRRLYDGTDVEPLVVEIVEGLERFGLPWLEARRTEDGFIAVNHDASDRGTLRALCILLWKQGRKKEYDEMKQRLRHTVLHAYPDRFETFFADLEAGRRPDHEAILRQTEQEVAAESSRRRRGSRS